MSKIVANRSEIVFLYDVKDSNPNGDPLDENKPRIDEETMVNLVTDVRLKRTIRDYLQDYRRIPVFIRESRKDNGTLKTKENLIDEEGIDSAEKLLGKYIDMRLFGATTAIKKKTITFTGPVQFKIGRSLHKVKLAFMKGTTVMPSKEGLDQGTFTEQYVLPYSLIGFYGVINENAAKTTGLTEDDVDLLLDGLWNGTKNLISRSKVGQMPRLLLKVDYRESNYHIGDLNILIRLHGSVPEDEIRDASQYRLDVTELVSTLKANAPKITGVSVAIDPHLQFEAGGSPVDLKTSLSFAGVPVKTLTL